MDSPLWWTLGQNGALRASAEMLTGAVQEVLTGSPKQQPEFLEELPFRGVECPLWALQG